MKLRLHPAFHECNPSLQCGVFGEAVWGTLDGQEITFAVAAGQYPGLTIYTEGHLTEEDFRSQTDFAVLLINRGGVREFYATVFVTERLVYPITREGGKLPLGTVFSDITEARDETACLVSVTDVLHEPRRA